jgi:hypothetical protein
MNKSDFLRKRSSIKYKEEENKMFNKKIVFIGDIHGRDGWIDIANDALRNFRHVVFLGDYVDSFHIRPVIIKQNLEAIIGFKIQNHDKVTLLLGNHDWAYIYDRTGISGFKWQVWQDYKKIFKDNIDLFDNAWGYTNPSTKKYTLATHAGLTYTYWNKYILPDLKNPESKLYKLTEGNGLEMEIHEILNFMNGSEIFWKVGNMRGGSGTPSPLWADYLELLDDPYPDINQVFGHTASGTTCLDQFGDYFLAKIDGYYNDKIKDTQHHLQINI